MRKVYRENAGSVKGAIGLIDPERIAAKASEGLLRVSVDIGLEVLRQMMEADVTELVGTKGKHNPARTAYRHGSANSKVVLGSEKVTVTRPRVRGKGGTEMPIKTLELFQAEDPLNEAILSRLLSGVSTRKLSRTTDDLACDPACVSKSEVSRRFISGMDEAMAQFFARPIEGSMPIMMLDGMGLGDMTIVAAMGIDAEGHKHILGLTEGGTENSEVVSGLLSDLISRGLDAQEPRLYVLDGGKALSKAVKDTFGKKAVIQRCQVHKKRNVLAHLPESEQENVSKRLTMAYREFEYEKAKEKLNLLAKELEMRYPKAADSLREGLEQTLTVHRLHVPGLLRETLSNTNAMESANSVCAGVLRRVTNFKHGGMTLRHAAAGFMEAERSFHRVRGYRQIPALKFDLARLTDCGDSSILDVA
jgi:Transposase and inactivated derivatives